VILPQALYNGVLGAACIVAMFTVETARAHAAFRPPRRR
jgi:uncharacterized membrane protein